MSVGIPMLRDLNELRLQNTYVIFDKGYDAKAIYDKAHTLYFEPIISLKKLAKSDGEWSTDCAPTCFLEHGYHYDSFG